MNPGITVVLTILQCFLLPSIELCEEERVVTPLYDLAISEADTTVTGVITMFSDKMQTLDIVSIDSGTAYRRARILLDRPVSPYGGGIITALIHPTGKDVSGYMIKAKLIDWSEEPLDREEARRSILRALQQRERRLSELTKKLGFEGWFPEGSLMLEGFAANSNIMIWSMAGRGFLEGILEKYPIMVFWTTPHGKIKRMFLTVRGHFYEAG